MKLTTETSAKQIAEHVKTIGPYPSGKYAGRGIVIPGGGSRLGTCAYVCVRMLRHLGCKLPIQIWHFERENDPVWKSCFADYDVEFVSLDEVNEPIGMKNLNGWETSAFAIIHSRFQEVLFLDADNVPVVDPTFLFDTPQYAETGAIFWPDFHTMEKSRSYWKVTGIPYRKEREFESGQIVVDKSRCWTQINLTNWLNENGLPFFFNHWFGDKDSYRAAWTCTGKAYSMPERGIDGLAGVMCQHDFGPKGRRIFQHRNMAKWELGDNRKIDGFMYESLCFTFMDQLKAEWFDVKQNLTTDDILATAQLAGSRMNYFRVGHDYRELFFGKDGTIKQGSGGREKMYLVKNGVLMILGDDGEVTCELTKVNDLWVGRWTMYERMPIILESIE